MDIEGMDISGMKWIELIQYRDNWRAFFKIALYFWFSSVIDSNLITIQGIDYDKNKELDSSFR